MLSIPFHLSKISFRQKAVLDFSSQQPDAAELEVSLPDTANARLLRTSVDMKRWRTQENTLQRLQDLK